MRTVRSTTALWPSSSSRTRSIPPHTDPASFVRATSFSGSGTRLHGQHIIDPRTGEPAGGPIGAWAFAPDSATSDALSTTFMIVTSSEIRSLCDRVDGAGAVWLTPAGELQSCGAIRGSLGH